MSGRRRKRPDNRLPARRLARELAMKVYFERDLTGRDPLDLFERYREDGTLERLDGRYAERLVQTLGANLPEIDARIAVAAPAFPVDQLATVDRNVLRVAVCELGDEFSVAPKVVINEAIEIAKDYGGEASGRFVNGALGALVDAAQRDADAAPDAQVDQDDDDTPDEPAAAEPEESETVEPVDTAAAELDEPSEPEEQEEPKA